MLDLLRAGLVSTQDEFGFRSGKNRPKLSAFLNDDGNFKIEGKGVFTSPSALATFLASGGSYNGWLVIVRVSDGVSLMELRKRFIQG